MQNKANTHVSKVQYVNIFYKRSLHCYYSKSTLRVPQNGSNNRGFVCKISLHMVFWKKVYIITLLGLKHKAMFY